MSNFIDMTGWDMSKKISDSQIIIIEKAERPSTNHGQHIFWKCQCKACGEYFIADGTKIRNGHTKTNNCWQSKIKFQPGDKFNQLTILKALGPIHQERGRDLWYECQCDCGKIVEACASELKKGTHKSCGGCAHSKAFADKAIKEYKNKTFNYLTAIEPTEKRDSGGSIIWKFKCQCGKDFYYTMWEVKNNIVTSCGCKAKVKSAGEIKIKQILDENNINYIHNKQFFKDLIMDNSVLRYDFVILDNKQNPLRLIEFDGKQHFESVDYFGGQDDFEHRQKSDKYKNQYALNHQIPLVRIPYYEINNLSYELLFNNKYLIQGE